VILVVGLGNPGSRYQMSRHNAGYLVVDRLFERARAPVWQRRFQGQFAQADWLGQRVCLLKPETFMNLSGRSVRRTAGFCQVPPETLLVAHDELDLPFGELRLKQGGGDAGHQGLASVTAELGSAGYGRLRFGIGRPPPDYRGCAADFVLEAFTPTEREELGVRLERAVEAIMLVVRGGMAAAMNVINQRKPSSLLQAGAPGADAHKENS
jgi:peptidyl-tRNA hydrolase, PTH1 family